MTNALPSWQWITSDQQLATLCTALRGQQAIGLDTEFVRETTFFPLPGLIQLASRDGVWLVDPLLINNWKPLAALLQDDAVIKVLHACSEDLELLFQLTDAMPANLFDTQLAAAFAGFGFSVGFQRLVHEVLGVELAKQETRSDWCKRPLSEEQCHYAAADAWYLLQLFQCLQEALQANGYPKLDWVRADCAQLVSATARNFDPDCAWRQVKLAWKLSPRQLAILREVASWREREARRRNQPRNRIIASSALWELARYAPSNKLELGRNRSLTPAQVRSEGRALLNAVERGLRCPEDELPAALPKPLPPKAKAGVKSVRQQLQVLAGQYGVASEVLLAKQQINSLVRAHLTNGDFQLPDNIEGWRVEALVPPLVEVLTQMEPNTPA